MKKFELKLPRMGESVTEATVTGWLKEVGDAIEADEAVLEIATDKIDSEVHSEVEGVLVEKLFKEDDVVQVGDVLAIIEVAIEEEIESVPTDSGLGAPITEKETTEAVKESAGDLQISGSDNGKAAFAASSQSEMAESITENAEELAETVEGTQTDVSRRIDEIIKKHEEKLSALESPKSEVTEVIEEPKETVEDSKKVVDSEIEAAAEKIENKMVQVAEKPKAEVDGKKRFFSPLVRNMAKQEGISLEELDSIKGTGAEGRVTKYDMINWLKERQGGAVKRDGYSEAGANGNTEFISRRQTASTQKSAGQAIAETQKKQDIVQESNRMAPTRVEKRSDAESETNLSSWVEGRSGHEEAVPMSRIGKLIAHHMSLSKKTSAHVQSFVEADVSNLVAWRKKVKDAFEAREGERLTFTPMFMEAIASTLKEFPMMNISVKDDHIVKKKSINLGMATSLADGNLIVPVIKNADLLNLRGMCKAVNDLANRGRTGKLLPEEVQEGTYTVTNVGNFGSIFGTPIINQPQVGIMAFGAIRKVPAVIETPEGDFIGIRHKLFLSHSYDHRVINGALGGMFVKRVADLLEAWDLNREI